MYRYSKRKSEQQNSAEAAANERARHLGLAPVTEDWIRVYESEIARIARSNRKPSMDSQEGNHEEYR